MFRCTSNNCLFNHKLKNAAGHTPKCYIPTIYNLLLLTSDTLNKFLTLISFLPGICMMTTLAGVSLSSGVQYAM